MPQNPDVHPHIIKMRKKIDKIDKKVLKLYKERFKCIEKLIRTKIATDMQIEDPEREKRMMKRWRKYFKGVDCDPEFLDDLFELVTDSSKKTQEQFHNRK